jgi:hypothetical protein
MTIRVVFGVALICALAAGPAFAQHGPSVLGTARIPDAVMVGDMPLQPGTYEIRLTGEHLAPLPGQSEDAGQVVEFVKDGVVVAKDAAEVVAADTAAVGTSGRRATGFRVERLKGDEFLRISITKDGERYLIHLPLAK